MQTILKDNKIILQFRYHPDTIEKVKMIPGRRWVPKEKQWEIPDCQQARAYLRHVLGLQLPPIQETLPKLDGEFHVLDGTRQPYPHQEEMSRFIIGAMLKNTSLGLFAETGTGKTQGMLDAINYFDGASILGVVPAPLLENWESEARDKRVPTTVIHGKPQTRHALIRETMAQRPGNRLVLTTYDTLVNDIEVWAEMRPDAVFFDESQLIKNTSTLRNKAARRLMCKCKILMTGTPYGNSLMDIHGQFWAVDQLVYGPKRSFQSAFCVFGGWEDKEIVEWKNEDLFYAILKRHAMVIRKADCLSLPPKMYQTIKLSMNASQRRAYNRAQQGAVGDTPITTVLAQIVKMRQISSGFVYMEGEADQFGTEKTEYLRSIAWDTPTIIWFNFHQEREDICKVLTDMGISHSVADGAHPAHNAVQQFESEQVDVLVAQLQSVQYGFTCNRAGRVIYYSPTFSQLQRSQSEDRSHRIGQTKSVLYISLVSSLVEEWCIEALQAKVEMKDYVLKKLKEIA